MKISTITLCKITFYLIASVILFMLYVDENNALSKIRTRNDSNSKHVVRGPQGPPGPPEEPSRNPVRPPEITQDSSKITESLLVSSYRRRD